MARFTSYIRRQCLKWSRGIMGVAMLRWPRKIAIISMRRCWERYALQTLSGASEKEVVVMSQRIPSQSSHYVWLVMDLLP